MGLTMDQLIAILYAYINENLAGTAWGQAAIIIAMISFALTHITPHLPPKVTEKIPDWAMVVINALAGQYKNCQNKLTDMKGNSR